jgi:cobalamin biosynthesis protein CobD/CbiB
MNNTMSLQSILGDFGNLLWDYLVYVLIFFIPISFFLWGMAVFILNAGNEDKRKEGKQRMFWGIIILVVMVSIWGIVSLLASVFI